LSSAQEVLRNRGDLRGELLLFRFEFLQRLSATHTHILLMTFKTPNKPAAAGLDAFAQPLYVARTIVANAGADVIQITLGLGGNHKQARRNEACVQKRMSICPPWRSIASTATLDQFYSAAITLTSGFGQV
jgi:hypothetical protein